MRASGECFHTRLFKVASSMFHRCAQNIDEYEYRKPIPKHTLGTPRPRYEVPKVNTSLSSFAYIQGSSKWPVPCSADAQNTQELSLREDTHTHTQPKKGGV